MVRQGITQCVLSGFLSVLRIRTLLQGKVLI